jgi:hypothetical protein
MRDCPLAMSPCQRCRRSTAKLKNVYTPGCRPSSALWSMDPFSHGTRVLTRARGHPQSPREPTAVYVGVCFAPEKAPKPRATVRAVRCGSVRFRTTLHACVTIPTHNGGSGSRGQIPPSRFKSIQISDLRRPRPRSSFRVKIHRLHPRSAAETRRCQTHRLPKVVLLPAVSCVALRRASDDPRIARSKNRDFYSKRRASNGPTLAARLAGK